MFEYFLSPHHSLVIWWQMNVLAYEDGHELLIPTGFVQMLNDKQKFTEYGYAFVMGLVGSYEPKKEEA